MNPLKEEPRSSGGEVMKLLHTADWHLGQTLYGRRRYEEFEAFLNWLAELIQQNGIDILLIAGDLFDSSTPSNRAQKLYYRFLCRAASSSCRHVVLIAGNHDSPSFLAAPKELLKTLNVHVVGSASDNLEDELLLLCDERQTPELLVCAVPYLRDRDLRTAEAGESLEDKEKKLIEGIRSHYAAVAALAEKKREELGGALPIVGMGHLFTAGGKTLEDDGVRELYIGSLAHVSAGMFPSCFNYLALGHLHVPQKVNGSETIRYSGSPLPMGFGESNQKKSLCQIEFLGREASVELIEVPVFQKLERIKGDWEAISKRLLKLAEEDSRSWLEVLYESNEALGDLRERLEAALSGTKMELLGVKRERLLSRALTQLHREETLDDLNEKEVFQRCLAAFEVPEEQHPELLRTYEEALLSLYEEGLE